MARAVHTYVEYTDTSGRPRTKKYPKFDHQTKLSDIQNWILEWWKGSHTFELEIKDPNGKFVDFDDEYLNQFKPFATIESPETSSTHLQVELRIIDNDGKKISVTFYFIFCI